MMEMVDSTSVVSFEGMQDAAKRGCLTAGWDSQGFSVQVSNLEKVRKNTRGLLKREPCVLLASRLSRPGEDTLRGSRQRDGTRKRRVRDSYLVDPASSYMLVSKIKPCMSKYKHLYCENCEWLIKSVIVYLIVPLLLG